MSSTNVPSASVASGYACASTPSSSRVFTADYALIGYPISQSLAPFFHNTCFELDGSESRYERWSTSVLTLGVLRWLRSGRSSGAAVTMPLKGEVSKHIDIVTRESRLTGAVNTIVKLHQPGMAVRLAGTNTDYIGILTVLRDAIQAQNTSPDPASASSVCEGYSAAVIGGGATTRSAILALHQLRLSPIYLVNRDAAEVESTISWFQQTELEGEGLRLVHLRDDDELQRKLEGAGEGEGPLKMIVGAIPAILPVTADERRVYAMATRMFTLGHLPGPCPDPASPTAPLPYHSYNPDRTANGVSSAQTRGSSSSASLRYPIFLDMAYYPRPTPLTQMARALGWQTVDGLEAMIEQGLAQQRMWRAGDPSVDVGMSIEGTETGATLSCETETEVRRRIREVVDGDLRVGRGDVETDRKNEV